MEVIEKGCGGSAEVAARSSPIPPTYFRTPSRARAGTWEGGFIVREKVAGFTLLATDPLPVWSLMAGAAMVFPTHEAAAWAMATHGSAMAEADDLEVVAL